MNIPARYCTGYLGDIGVPPVPDPMDFSAWFEVYLGGHWYTFDARHNKPRIGRILMATGRDATDVAISTSFGPSRLVGFKVVTDEVPHAAPPCGRPTWRNGFATESVEDMPRRRGWRSTPRPSGSLQPATALEDPEGHHGREDHQADGEGVAPGQPSSGMTSKFMP